MTAIVMLGSMGRFVILWIFSVLPTLHLASSWSRQSDDVGDICQGILSCKCYPTQLPGNNATILSANCIKPSTQDLQRLLEYNIEKFTLNQGTQNDIIRALKLLQNESIPIISLDDTKLKTLNMSLLPENTKRLSLIDNTALDEITSSNCEHDMKRLQFFQSLSIQIDGEKAPDLKCLPESTKYLTISGASSISKFKWPKFLQYLKSSFMLEGYPTEALGQVGPNLRTLHVSYANIRNGFMPMIMGSTNITNIIIQHCNVSFVDIDTFLHNRQLKRLDLAGNSITRFDAIMPATLKYLMLRYNKIELFKFKSTAESHLIYLGLHHNFLRKCPMQLPKTLKMLVLNHNNIEICSREALERLTELKQLDLAHNRLKIVPSGIKSKLESYRINGNLLSRIYGPENYEFCSDCNYMAIGGNDWFCDIHFLKFLMWISHRICRNLAEYAFTQEYLEKVANYTRHIESPPNDACVYEPQQQLNCTNANLTTFPNTPPRGLKSVIISGNYKLTNIPDFLYANQGNLREITLSMNNLKRIPFGLPSCVEWLDLQENNITELSPKDILAFNNLTKLENLILHDNHIKTVLSQDFSALKSLTWVGLEGNDLVCDCSLHSFILWYTQLNERYPYDNHLIRFARCNNPPDLKHRDVRKLYYHYEYELQCVSPLCEFDEKSKELNCSIHSQMNSDRTKLHALSGPIYGEFPKIFVKDYWRKMFLDGLRLEDEDVIVSEFINLLHLDLSNNLLKQWSPKRLPISLQMLNLRGNLINALPEMGMVLTYQPNLKMVDLRDNMIKTVMPKQTATLMSLSELYMDGNPFECTCPLGTFKLWLKMNATAIKHKSDAEILRCSGPQDLAGRKLINLKEEDICKTTTSVDIKIWILAGLFIGVLLLSMIVTIQVIKRRRYRQQILKGFQRLLQQDACYNYALVESEVSIPEMSNIDTYTFDAFIATEECDDDGQFVEELIRELENERQLRLCISTRDFISGVDISDNIIEGITSSKIVILLISKTFVTSPWCQYKVQIALAELHKRRRKLLIPIVFEDLTTDAGNNLKTLLSMIPTFKVPSHRSSKRERQKFWNSLYDAICS